MSKIIFRSTVIEEGGLFVQTSEMLKCVYTKEMVSLSTICKLKCSCYRGGMQELFELLTFGEGVHLSKEPMFSFTHTFIVSKGRIWTNKVHLEIYNL